MCKKHLIFCIFFYFYLIINHNGVKMKIKRTVIFIVFAILTSISANYYSAYAKSDYLYLGGIPAGFSLATRGAYVVGLCDVVSEKGVCSPSKDAQVEVGDIILYINDYEINGAADIEKAVTDDCEKIMVVSRKGQKILLEIIPAKDFNGNYRIGVFVRDNVNGIGTITYIKDNRFASLGHPVLDDDGMILNIKGGTLYPCNISGYVKGERGKPGELRGAFVKKAPCAEIEKNTYQGVYGTLTDNSITKGLKKVSVGEAKMGNASIMTTIDGCTPKEYSISIIKVDNVNKDSKNFVIKITDETLISKTGGIIQGMSGSPIIQDGRLVGAVTHVFINDPTRGFGISIENMLNN